MHCSRNCLVGHFYDDAQDKRCILLLLKRLEMYGFKSFADRIQIEFDKGITAIVGPNGSGKSNVADAVRWVLGEQSAKSLRGSKMEDIIFSGTQERRPLGFAEVSLTLDNLHGAIPVDFAEVTITRRVFRSGESEYYINRSPCRLRDITELFMDTGVGKEGYSIIGQGRIEGILSTQPENRRQIFEEAAGIVKYKSRKQESERKLASVRENIIRIHDVLGEISHQLGPLEEQSKAAREYLDLRDKLKFYDLNRFIMEYDSHREKVDQIKNNVALLAQDISNHRTDIRNQETKNQELNGRLTGVDEQIQNLAHERYEKSNEIERLTGKVEVIKERISQLDREKSRLEKEIAEEGHTISKKEEARVAALRDLEKEKEKQETVLLKSTELNIELEKIQRELASSHLESQQKKSEQMEIWNTLSQAKNSITKYEALKSNLEEQRLDSDVRVEELIEDRTALRRRHMENERLVDELLEQEKIKKQERIILEQKKACLKQELEVMDDRLQLQKQQLEGHKSRLKLLVDMEKTYDGFQKTVRNILVACRNNSVLEKRVCGVIAELIDVPREYEVAIETALGASLQHIVTHDEQDAKYMIELLRQKKWGRATFLPISSIQPRFLNERERGALSLEGCLGRGTDLVAYEPKYADILSNLLGRIIIMKTLDQAVDIAKRFSYSFRIVTLEGDIINAGGSMTGGSLHRRSAGIIGRGREISDLKARITSLVKDMKSTALTRETHLVEYNKLADALRIMSEEIHELEIAKATGSESLEGTRNQIEIMDKDIQRLSANNNNMAQEIERLQESIGEQENLIEGLETQIERIQATVLNTDSTIEDINRRKGQVDEGITKVRLEMAGLEHEIGHLGDKIHQLDGEISLHTQSLDAKSKVVDDNSDTAIVCAREINGYIEKIGRLSREVEKDGERLTQKQSHKETLAQEISGIERRIKELAKIVDEIQERRHGMDIQLSRTETELENIQNNIWQEYEVTYANALGYRDNQLGPARVKREIHEIKQRIDRLGDVNVKAIEEYKRIKERFDFLTRQKDDLTEAKDNLLSVISDITSTMEQRFIKEFAIINDHFNGVFRRLFGGGKAGLVLEDPDDVLASGIEIIAQPPGKKLQNINLLSGGEKSLTAIAILFAILEHKPAPFCVLDEIEAALDESNVQNFGKFLKEFCERTQFVLITHRKGTMENSDVLYGVAMEEKGVSRMISVRLEDEIAS
ncbi:MAG TPA: chromosome segregation protein SMC [Clostridia bacterium]|nr:chromosome segregation protein SMC [Clostridia bacterium]